jgi:hypothetical protein
LTNFSNDKQTQESLESGFHSGKQTQPYIHNTFHEYGKLGPRGKKCIFILYSEHSKEFVFIGEKADGRVTEIESCDVVFL